MKHSNIVITDDCHKFTKSIPKEGRLLSIDFGTKKMGIALSDLRRVIASPFGNRMRSNIDQDLLYFKQLQTEFELSGFIIGLPIEMSGRMGRSSETVNEFAGMLHQECQIPILLQDERLSTAAVKRMLNGTKLTRKKKDILDDKLAACYILQITLDQMRNLL